MKKLGIVFVIVIVVIGWITFRHSVPKGASAAKLAPDFSVTDLAGHDLRLSNYRGKVVVLDFWATWCEPCRQEIPHFIELQSKYPERLQVIGISVDDDTEPVRSFQQQYKMNYPVALGSAQLADQYGGVLGLPITFVIDREGRIASRHIGPINPSAFEEEIRRLP